MTNRDFLMGLSPVWLDIGVPLGDIPSSECMSNDLDSMMGVPEAPSEGIESVVALEMGRSVGSKVTVRGRRTDSISEG